MGNACLSGSVNVPIERGQWPRPPKQPNCLHCGTEMWINRRGDPNKKFCNESCATTHNMALRLRKFHKRCGAIEQCLSCHDRLDLKSRASGQLVGLPRSFAMNRRRRIGYNPARVIAATHKRVSEAKRPECRQRQQQRHIEYRVKQEQKIAWAQEWRGVIDCWQAWQIERKAKNRAKGYAWQTLKRATDWEWRERTRIRMKCNGIKKAKPHSNKYIIELGCSYWQAKKHIERQWLPGMSWENHGTAWEIDHIIPASRFDVNNPMQRLQMCHFTNLQPLWTRDNRRKLNRVEPRSSLQLVML
jgi:hypothetical protein